MKIKFDEFINENYKLFISNDIEEFNIGDDKWLSELNLANIWDNYKKNKNEDVFLKNYKNVILNKKNEFLNINKSCWEEISNILNENDVEFFPHLNKIYDWADKYGIKIKS